MSAGARDTLQVLRSIEVPGGVSPTAWEAAVSVSRRTFCTHRAILVRGGHVVDVGTERRPKYAAAARRLGGLEEGGDEGSEEG